MKTYEVSLTVSQIEADNKEEAIANFEALVEAKTFGSDSYEVKNEKED